MSKKVASVHDYARMCTTVEKCTDCPFKEIYVIDKTCSEVIRIFPDKTNELILKWCEEHPIKTYRQDFLEKFPNAPLGCDGTPVLCVRDIYSSVECNDNEYCGRCWNKPMEV